MRRQFGSPVSSHTLPCIPAAVRDFHKPILHCCIVPCVLAILWILFHWNLPNSPWHCCLSMRCCGLSRVDIKPQWTAIRQGRGQLTQPQLCSWRHTTAFVSSASLYVCVQAGCHGMLHQLSDNSWTPWAGLRWSTLLPVRKQKDVNRLQLLLVDCNSINTLIYSVTTFDIARKPPVMLLAAVYCLLGLTPCTPCLPSIFQAL